MQSICVYCGSSSKVDPVFLNTAKVFGEILAKNKIRLIYGGGALGLMGELAKSVLATGGEVVGVIPRFMYEEGWCMDGLTELVIVESMHERKKKMEELADALVALPGGVGTMEELLEAITWKQLGLMEKPIIVVNIENYYRLLFDFFEQAAEKQFMRQLHLDMWEVVSNANEVLLAIEKSAKWDGAYRKFAAI